MSEDIKRRNTTGAIVIRGWSNKSKREVTRKRNKNTGIDIVPVSGIGGHDTAWRTNQNSKGEGTQPRTNLKTFRGYQVRRNRLIKITAVMSVVITGLSLHLMTTEDYWGWGTAFFTFGCFWIACYCRANWDRFMRWLTKEKPAHKATGNSKKSSIFYRLSGSEENVNLYV